MLDGVRRGLGAACSPRRRAAVVALSARWESERAVPRRRREAARDDHRLLGLRRRGALRLRRASRAGARAGRGGRRPRVRSAPRSARRRQRRSACRCTSCFPARGCRWCRSRWRAHRAEECRAVGPRVRDVLADAARARGVRGGRTAVAATSTPGRSAATCPRAAQFDERVLGFAVAAATWERHGPMHRASLAEHAQPEAGLRHLGCCAASSATTRRGGALLRAGPGRRAGADRVPARRSSRSRGAGSASVVTGRIRSVACELDAGRGAAARDDRAVLPIGQHRAARAT